MLNNSTLLLTSIPEGTCIKTTVGGSKPEFILAYKDHHFDRDWNIVNTKDWSDDDERWESMGIRLPTITDALLRQVGLYWVGIPPRRVEEMERSWTEWSHDDPATGKAVQERFIKMRKDRTRYFFAKKFAYPFLLEGLPTRGGFRVNVKITIFVEGINPKIATVDNDDWFSQLESHVRRWCRDFIGAKNFFQLISEEPAVQALLRKHDPLQRYLEDRHKDKKAGDVEEEAVTPKFSVYMAIAKPQGKGQIVDGDDVKPPVDMHLSEVIGVRIMGATLEEVDLDPTDPLIKELSGLEIQEIQNNKGIAAAEAGKKIKIIDATGTAAAADIITASKKNRQAAHAMYEGKPHATAVALAEAQEAVGTAQAGSVKGNAALRSVVWPNSPTQPVFSVNAEPAEAEKET